MPDNVFFKYTLQYVLLNIMSFVFFLVHRQLWSLEALNWSSSWLSTTTDRLCSNLWSKSSHVLLGYLRKHSLHLEHGVRFRNSGYHCLLWWTLLFNTYLQHVLETSISFPPLLSSSSSSLVISNGFHFSPTLSFLSKAGPFCCVRVA